MLAGRVTPLVLRVNRHAYQEFLERSVVVVVAVVGERNRLRGSGHRINCLHGGVRVVQCWRADSFVGTLVVGGLYYYRMLVSVRK